MFKLNPFHKHTLVSPTPPAPAKSTEDAPPFTEEQIRAKAHQVWKRRIAQGKSGTPGQDWQKAIEELQLSWWDRWWAWTGIPDKKGWDLVQLLTSVSIPVVIFAGGSWFTYWNNQQQQRIAEDRRKQDIQLADDKAKQDTLVKYLDDMSKSIEGGLLDAAPGSKPFIVAQSRTVLALQSLDKKRQHLVVQFLQASGLNQVSVNDNTTKFLEQTSPWNLLKPPKNVKLGLLYGAQMVKANLANSDLSGAKLIGANLEGANLGCNPSDSKAVEHCSDLSEADLRSSNFTNATLEGVNLGGADLKYVDLFNADLNNAGLTSTDFSFADLFGANLEGAALWDANLSNAHLDYANFKNAILIYTDLAGAKNLTPNQLTGKDAPLICNARFPNNISGIDLFRDCDRVPQEILRRYPKAFSNLEEAKKFVNESRQEKFK